MILLKTKEFSCHYYIALEHEADALLKANLLLALFTSLKTPHDFFFFFLMNSKCCNSFKSVSVLLNYLVCQL